MAIKRFATSKTIHAKRMDDLKLIRGIGPVIEKHLRAEGIRSFGQIEKLSAELVANLVPNVSADQIRRQGWIRQARRLASKKTGVASRKKGVAASTSRQHYENFTFEFLIDEKNKIHRMRVVHVQSGDTDTWTEWNTERMMTFLTWHTGACLPGVQPVTAARLYTTRTSPSIPSSVQSSEIVENGKAMPQEQSFNLNIPQNSAYLEKPSPPAPTQPLCQFRLVEWKTRLSNTHQPISTLPHDRAFEVGLTLDLSDAPLSGETQLHFTIKLYAKRVGNGHRELVNETQSTVPNSNIVNLSICDIALSQGLYRLEALVNLILPGNSQESVFQGGLLQVY